mmetsp:Transcript_26402/g.59784  ORF Transcript_26402/g.59784 Transcript_26402/m.59784 type:complete len:331 (+) Transcript_26402:201-1193(+)
MGQCVRDQSRDLTHASVWPGVDPKLILQRPRYPPGLQHFQLQLVRLVKILATMKQTNQKRAQSRPVNHQYGLPSAARPRPMSAALRRRRTPGPRRESRRRQSKAGSRSHTAVPRGPGRGRPIPWRGPVFPTTAIINRPCTILGSWRWPPWATIPVLPPWCARSGIAPPLPRIAPAISGEISTIVLRVTRVTPAFASTGRRKSAPVRSHATRTTVSSRALWQIPRPIPAHPLSRRRVEDRLVPGLGAISSAGHERQHARRGRQGGGAGNLSEELHYHLRGAFQAPREARRCWRRPGWQRPHIQARRGVNTSRQRLILLRQADGDGHDCTAP